MSGILGNVIDTTQKILNEVGIEKKVGPDDIIEGKLVIVVRKLYHEYGRPATKLGMRKVWDEFRKEERALWSRIYGTSTRNKQLKKISLKSFCKYYNALTRSFDQEIHDLQEVK